MCQNDETQACPPLAEVSRIVGRRWMVFKRFVSFLAVFNCCFFAFSQNEIITTATGFIRNNKFDIANNYLDSILKIQPRNVDALMMKGNVRLNYEYVNQPDYFAINEDMESVFDTSMISKQTGIKIIPYPVALGVEKIWKQCLTIDSSRIDIRKGLCSLYGMALMKEQLKKEIPELIKWDKNEDELAFKIANYAREFKERGEFVEAIEIYMFIAQQFPGLAGIRCDIGSEYFYAGEVDRAIEYLDTALSEKNIDETTYLNAAFIYSELGYFDKAYKAFKGYSQTFHTKMDMFYQGLLLFAKADKGYTVVFKNFTTSIDSNAYYPEYRLANSLQAYEDSFTLQNLRSLSQQDIPLWYKPFIYQRYMGEHPDSCEAFARYGILEASIKNFDGLTMFFLEQGKKCTLPASLQEEWKLCYAYALYRHQKLDQSLLYFKTFFTSIDAFKQQAAKYFASKILWERKNFTEMEKLLKEISASDKQTKYGVLSRYRLVMTK